MAASNREDSPDRNAEVFNVYVSADMKLETAREVIRSDYSEDSEGLELQAAHGLTVQQICRRHRQLAEDGGPVYTTLFLVVDSDQPDVRGVLAVNLGPYHGYPDAVRKAQGGAGDCIASLSISNSSWYEERQSVGGKSPLVPEDWFALYNLLPSSREKEFEVAVKTMNDGVQEVNTEEDREADPDNIIPIPFGLTKQYHRGIKPPNQDLAQVIQAHPAFAERESVDPAYFAVIDDRYEGEGALIVRLQSGMVESFRCTNPVAGEMLGWIYINFMTWEEAKEFAAAQ